MAQRFVGKSVLITGGNSGIGRSAAHLFAHEGANVAIAARDVDRNQQVLAELTATGANAISLECDVTDPASARSAVDETVARLGAVDVLFNNAGMIYREKTVLDTEPSEWETTMAVNTTGVFLMSRAALPHMIESGGGAIVNNASYFGLVGGRGAAAYCAAKGAVVNLTRAMALDHAHQNVRVNCVCPGSVDTPMLHAELELMGGADQVLNQFEAKHPLGRIAQPHEVAAAVVYLASADAQFITGVALPVDGGITAG